MKRLLMFCVAMCATAAFASPVGPVRTFQVTCATTATRISDSKGTPAFLLVWNNSATPAFIGGSDVNDSTKGMPICTDTATCKDSAVSIDTMEAYCLSTGGAVVVTVMAGKGQ